MRTMREAQQEFRRYAALVAAVLPPVGAFTPDLEGPTTVQVERGGVFPACLQDPQSPLAWERVDRLADLAAMQQLPRVAVVDRAGHDRPVYRPLLVYAWLQAYRLAYEVLPRSQFGRWEEGLRPWCDLLEAVLTNLPLAASSPEGIPAAQGHVTAEAAWSALALFVAGRVFIRDAWTDLAADAFGRLTRAQAPARTWLTPTAADNPETLWYHELVILHAAASYAVQAEDRSVAAAVARNARHHLDETQPDHATAQPWGVFAFIWHPDTHPLADQVLHAAGIQHPPLAESVASILLADTLYCLRLFG
jgi:hypothetical protein